MNYIELGFWGLTALFLVFGVIMGAVRGSNRSILRLVLVVLSAVAAFFLRTWVTNKILSAKVKGDATVEEVIINLFGSSLAEMGETVKIMVAVFASVFIFLAIFYLLKLLTWMIVYPLCKLFVKKGKKKHPIFGACIGLVQGVIVALCICVPLAGLVAQANKLMAAVGDMQEMSATVPSDGYYASTDESPDFMIDDVIDGEDEGETEEPDEEEPPVNPDDENGEGGTTEGGDATEPADEGKGGPLIPQEVLDKMNSFSNSFIGKFYTKTLKTPFRWISSVKVETTDKDGKKVKETYTLDGQVDAVVCAIRMIKDFADLRDIDWNGDFDKDVAEQIKAVFNKLDETKGELSDESIKTINNVANLLINSMGLPDGVEVDMDDFDLNTVKFADEGALILDVVDVATKEEFTSEDLKTITADLEKSTLVMPMLESVKNPMNLSEDKKAMVESAFQDPELSNAEQYDQDVLNTLRFLFGLSESEQ